MGAKVVGAAGAVALATQEVDTLAEPLGAVEQAEEGVDLAVRKA